MNNTNPIKLIKINWDDIYNICYDFKKRNSKKFDFIIAITRGGWIPSVIISHLLNIRLVLPFQIYETENDVVNAKKLNPNFGENIDFKCIKNKKILIVDDIFGSGATLSAVKNYLKSYTEEIYTFSCVMNKNNYDGKYELPNFVGRKVKGWVLFPWEEEKYEG